MRCKDWVMRIIGWLSSIRPWRVTASRVLLCSRNYTEPWTESRIWENDWKNSFLAMWKENSLMWTALVVILHRMKEKLMQILIVHPNLKVKAELKTVGRAVLRWEWLSPSTALCHDYIRIVDTGAVDCSHASGSKRVRAINWLGLFCSKQFFGKIGFVRSLSDLSRVQSVQFADVPMPVRNYDRRHQRNVMTNTCC